jgi:glycyl-tRNA synthetase
MTQMHDNIVGLDAAILMHPKIWEASGHIKNFTDPLVDCKQCKSRFRADQIDLEAACPTCGTKDSFTQPRNFNLMFSTHIGSVEDEGSLIYLRPETAQGIYADFKSVVQSSRVKVPFGIAQVGKAFRNEITTKSFIFRSVEFEQMEMQFFVKPGEDDKWFSFWREERLKFYHKMGIKPASLRWHQHGPDELAFYAKEAFDIQFLFPMGWQELEGIHNRTDYDLSQHQQFSGKELTYLDQETNERFVPYVVETSAGLTRNVLMALSDAYEEQTLENNEVRTVLHFHPAIAPITVAVLPLVKKDGLGEVASKLDKELREDFTTFYDQNGAIGRRYRRMDEIGTPYCITVDYQTLEDNSVTLRYRDSMKQIRVPMNQIVQEIRTATKNYKRVE